MDEKKARSHVNLVAVLHIALGAITVFGAIITFIAINFGLNFIPEEEEIPIEIIRSIIAILPLTMGIFGVIDILAGAALYSYKQWARILVIVISAINCLNIPIGTAKGVYSIWALMVPEVQELFE